MSEEERLQLENECLMKYSKAQMIQKYIDELEESSKLSELWCKSQEENKRLNQKYLNAVADYELEKFNVEELKKQLEDTNEELELVRCDLHNRTSERNGYYRNIEKLENQQKEFINWLIENESLDDYCNETTFTSIREKYEEIIGGK